MNQAQALSLARTAIKIIGTALATHGLTKAAGIVNGEDVSGLVMTLFAIYFSQKTHSKAVVEAPKAVEPVKPETK